MQLSSGFIAIDVETANPDLVSICQVGIVTFSNGKAVEYWQSLIDPEDEFDPINVSCLINRIALMRRYMRTGTTRSPSLKIPIL